MAEVLMAEARTSEEDVVAVVSSRDFGSGVRHTVHTSSAGHSG
jgi:hypothetical protein